jgi:hypothetical protein
MGQPEEPTGELSHAGAVIDKAIEHMTGQGIGSLAIASALLGGALGLLARAMTERDILAILDKARDCVVSGDLRRMAGPSHDA